MGLKYKIPYDLDSPQRTIEHREIIKNKKPLRKLYESWYQHFIDEAKSIPKGKIIELGSGGGFLKELLPDVICSDIIDLPDNDMTFSALDMPFEDNSVAAIFMIDTMHHIPDSKLFLQEAQRVLMKGGKIVMVEPANSGWGRFIYQNFHHEPFEPNGGWTIPSSGPLSGANGALPWIVFERDKSTFLQQFPSFKIETIKYINPFSYLLSGGVSFKQLVPNFLFSLVSLLDRFLPKLSKNFSMFMLIKIKKV